MRYRLFIIIIFVFFLNDYLYSQSTYSAKISIPSEIVQGDVVLITLDIYKPEGLRNFTTFSQKLPPGFYVKAIDLKGATLSFENNELILTWLRISEKTHLSVTYEISTMVGLSGTFNISGQLSYMIGSSQGKFDLKNYVLKVSDKEKLENITELKNDDVITPTYKPNLKDIKCSRKVVYNKRKGLYDIEIHLKKKEKGSYTIVEQIPGGFKFSETESHNAEVNQTKSLLQYYWKELSGTKEIVISYQLIPDKNNIKPKISGKLSWISNKQILNLQIYTEN